MISCLENFDLLLSETCRAKFQSACSATHNLSKLTPWDFWTIFLFLSLKSNNSPLDVVAKLKNLPLKNRNERAQTQKEEKGKKRLKLAKRSQKPSQFMIIHNQSKFFLNWNMLGLIHMHTRTYLKTETFTNEIQKSCQNQQSHWHAGRRHTQ